MVYIDFNQVYSCEAHSVHSQACARRGAAKGAVALPSPKSPMKGMGERGSKSAPYSDLTEKRGAVTSWRPPSYAYVYTYKTPKNDTMRELKLN